MLSVMMEPNRMNNNMSNRTNTNTNTNNAKANANNHNSADATCGIAVGLGVGVIGNKSEKTTVLSNLFDYVDEDYDNEYYDEKDDEKMLSYYGKISQTKNDCFEDTSESQSESFDVIVCARHPANSNASCTSSITNSFHSLMSSYSLGSSRRTSMGFGGSRRSSMTNGLSLFENEGGSAVNHIFSSPTMAMVGSRRSSLTNSIMEESSFANYNNNPSCFKNGQYIELGVSVDDDQSQSEASDFDSEIHINQHQNLSQAAAGGTNSSLPASTVKRFELPLDVQCTTSPKRKYNQSRTATNRLNYLPCGVFNTSTSMQSVHLSSISSSTGAAAAAAMKPHRRASVGCSSLDRYQHPIHPHSSTMAPPPRCDYQAGELEEDDDEEEDSSTLSSASKKHPKKQQRVTKRLAITGLTRRCNSSEFLHMMNPQPYHAQERNAILKNTNTNTNANTNTNTSATIGSVHSQSTTSTIPHEQKIEIKKLLQDSVTAVQEQQGTIPVSTSETTRILSIVPTRGEGTGQSTDSNDTSMISTATAAADSSAAVRFATGNSTAGNSSKVSSYKMRRQGMRRYQHQQRLQQQQQQQQQKQLQHNQQQQQQQDQKEQDEREEVSYRRDSRTTLGSGTTFDSAPKLPRRHLSPVRG